MIGRVQIFHIAQAAQWEAAQAAGSYTESTWGRSLEDEGFIHAARADQWAHVQRRYYGGVKEPLVLLVIDTGRLASPWQEDVVGDTTYPHIHGPLNLDAVVAAVPLGETTDEATVDATAAGIAAVAPSRERTFLQEFIGEMSFRMTVAVAAMVFALACALTGQALVGDAGGASGLLLGAAAGAVVGFAATRRRTARLAR